MRDYGTFTSLWDLAVKCSEIPDCFCRCFIVIVLQTEFRLGSDNTLMAKSQANILQDGFRLTASRNFAVWGL